MTSSGTTTITEETALTGQPLYVLRRRQRCIWPLPGTSVSGTTTSLPEVSIPSVSAATGGSGRINDYNRVTVPALRAMMQDVSAMEVSGLAPPVANTDIRYSGQTNLPTAVEDIVIADVLSFDVALLVDGDTEFRDLSHANIQAYTNANTAFTGGTTWCFDTWTNQQVGSFDYSGTKWSTSGNYASIPLYINPATGNKIRVRAIQITLRIWNQKGTGTTGPAPQGAVRQMTIIQDL
jgi:hypothetical protein